MGEIFITSVKKWLLLKLLYVLFLIPFVVYPAFAQNTYEILPSEKGTLNVGFTTIPSEIKPGDTAKLQIDFLNTKSNNIQEHIDYRVTVSHQGENIFGPIPLTHTSSGAVKIPVKFPNAGDHSVLIEMEGILFQPIPLETVSFNFEVADAQSEINGQTENGGGCLIATATFGTELAPQVQFLRELRDNTVLNTSSGTSFMIGFNTLYYSFSPTIADWERENPIFKEVVKMTITPLLTSLTLLNYVEINSEAEMLGYGIGVMLLNIGLYFGIPAIIITKISRSRTK